MTCEYQIRLEVEDQEREIQVQPEAYNQASGGTIEITDNGQYDVTKYQTADVAVPLPQGQIDIKQNGIVNVYDYATANVAVPADTSDIFNTTIVSNKTNNSDTLKEQFINYDSISLPDTFDFNLSVLNAISLFSGWGFKNLKVSGEITGTGSLASTNYMFNGCSNLTSLDLSGLDTSSVTNMSYMISSCPSLVSLDLSGLDTSSVTNMSYMSNGCSNLTSLDLSGFDTSSVTNMANMFGGCSNLTLLDLSGCTTESITNNSYLFRSDEALEAVVIDSPSVFTITNSNAFQLSSITNGGTGFVYVPDSLVDEYKSATNWTTVADQIKPLSELPQEVKDVFGM